MTTISEERIDATTTSLLSPDSRPPVLIIGGGIIGLTLAQALQSRSLPFVLYERSPSATSVRGPGWGLTIHWALALFRSLVPQSVLDRLSSAMVDPDAVARGEKGTFVFYDALTAEKRFEVPPSERLRLRREGLRSVLLGTEGLEAKVNWGKKFEGFQVVESGMVVARFADGTESVPGALLVGCDGANSQVRQSLLGAEMARCTQLPVRCLGATVVFSVETAKKMRELDPYFMQMGDETQDVFVYFAFIDGPTNNSREDKETRTCQIFMSWPFRPEKNGFGEVPEGAAERVALMKKLSQEWAEPFHGIIQAIPKDNQPISLRLEDWLPERWGKIDGAVTLAGDAGHAMTTYRGEAFNHGLKDLVGLVAAIEEVYKAGEAWISRRKVVIDGLEEEVQTRTRVAVLASRRACLDAHDQKARLSTDSPLVAMRTMNAKELGFD